MRRQTIWTAAFLGGAISALMLLASNVSGLQFRPGRFYAINIQPLFGGPGGALPTPPPGTFLQRLLALIALGLLIYLVIALIFSSKLRRELLQRVLITFSVVLFIYLFVGALRSAPVAIDQAGQPSPTPAPGEAGFAEPFPSFTAQPPLWLVILISLLFAALLIGLAWLVWRRSRKPKPALQQLADEAQAALRDLEAGGDLADTVLRCYREMSRVLSEQRGIERSQDVTPREFERQLAVAGAARRAYPAANAPVRACPLWAAPGRSPAGTRGGHMSGGDRAQLWSGAMRRRLALLGLFAVLVALLALLLSGLVRELIVIPLLHLLWLMRVLFESIPQVVIWVGVLVLLAIMAWNSLSRPRPGPFARPTAAAASRAPVAAWAANFERAARDDYARQLLAQRLGQLAFDLLASQDRQSDQTIWELLRDPALDIPPEVRAYFQAGIRMQRPLPTLWERLRAWFTKPERFADPLDLDPEQVIRFLEQRAHRE